MAGVTRTIPGRVEASAWQAAVTSANASSTDLVVKAGTAAKKITVRALIIAVDTSLTVTVKDEDGTTLAGPFYIPAYGLAPLSFPAEAPLRVTTADKNLEVSTSGAGNITVTATGFLYD